VNPAQMLWLSAAGVPEGYAADQCHSDCGRDSMFGDQARFSREVLMQRSFTRRACNPTVVPPRKCTAMEAQNQLILGLLKWLADNPRLTTVGGMARSESNGGCGANDEVGSLHTEVVRGERRSQRPLMVVTFVLNQCPRSDASVCQPVCSTNTDTRVFRPFDEKEAIWHFFALMCV